jgi:hypothetical protein
MKIKSCNHVKGQIFSNTLDWEKKATKTTNKIPKCTNKCVRAGKTKNKEPWLMEQEKEKLDCGNNVGKNHEATSTLMLLVGKRTNIKKKIVRGRGDVTKKGENREVKVK